MESKSSFVFDKKNFAVIIAGFLVIVLGFLMMSGGKAESPDEFHYEEIFSPTRITMAPAVVLIGFIIVGVGIMIKPKSKEIESH